MSCREIARLLTITMKTLRSRRQSCIIQVSSRYVHIDKKLNYMKIAPFSEGIGNLLFNWKLYFKSSKRWHITLHFKWKHNNFAPPLEEKVICSLFILCSWCSSVPFFWYWTQAAKSLFSAKKQKNKDWKTYHQLSFSDRDS